AQAVAGDDRRSIEQPRQVVAPLVHADPAAIGRAGGATQTGAQQAPILQSGARGEIPPARAVARQPVQEDEGLQSVIGLRGARSARMSSMRAWIAPLMRGWVRM